MEKNNELRGLNPLRQRQTCGARRRTYRDRRQNGCLCYVCVYARFKSYDRIRDGVQPLDTAVLLGSILRQIPRPEAMVVLECLKSVLNEEDTKKDTEDND